MNLRQNLAVLNAGSTGPFTPGGPYVNGARPKISAKSSVLNSQTAFMCSGAPAVFVHPRAEKLPTYTAVYFTDYKELLTNSET